MIHRWSRHALVYDDCIQLVWAVLMVGQCLTKDILSVGPLICMVSTLVQVEIISLVVLELQRYTLTSDFFVIGYMADEQAEEATFCNLLS